MYAIFYDAVRRFFRRAKHLGQPVDTVFARPDRAHTELARLREEQLKREKHAAPAETATRQAVEDRPTASPFMSVWIPSPQFDKERFSPATFRGITKDRATGNATSMRYPRPVLADVQVDLWAGDVGGELIAQGIEVQVESFFIAESVYLPIDYGLTKWYKPPFNTPEHAKAYGRTRIRLMVANGWMDNSDLEEGGDGPKEIRRTWTGKMEAFIPYRPEEARLVLRTDLLIYDNTDETSPVLLAERTSDAED
jgi:hypothetical protein